MWLAAANSCTRAYRSVSREPALTAEGIRTAFYFGIACGRELRAVLAGERTRDAALAAYGAFSRRHARAFAWALALQRAIPALPPRLLARLLRLVGRRRLS